VQALRAALAPLCRSFSGHHLGNALRRLRGLRVAGCTLETSSTRTSAGVVWEIVLLS
jgi:hypothetical protein